MKRTPKLNNTAVFFGGTGMKQFMMAGLAVIVAMTLGPPARADIALQDFGVNINGTTYDYNNLGQPDTTTLPGMNATGFSTFTSGDGLGTGLGTLIYTFNPGSPGSYFVNFYFDEEASVPFFNEYGRVNGSAPAGMSYEIAGVNPSVGGIQFWNGTTQILPNALDDTNHVPGTSTNYLNNCAGGVAAGCNGDVAEALGFSFVLPAGDEAVITIDQSTSNPGGFNLQQVHPIDPNNASATDLFLSGSIDIQPSSGPPPPPAVPEPSTSVLFGTVVAILGYAMRRRFARA
jgi:hypothetical protein